MPEFFVNKRRLALPAIVLLLAFEFGLIASVLGWFHPGSGEAGLTGWAVASAVASAGAWLHWLRFKVPITIVAGLAALIGFLTALLLSLVSQSKDWIPAISLLTGTLHFLMAMRWDPAVLTMYMLLALVSLVIDRRALMASSLTYVIYAYGSLLTQLGVVSMSFAITALSVGSGLLLLFVFWQRARAGVLALLPRAIRERLPEGRQA